MSDSVVYLGHKFTSEGMSPTNEKAADLQNAKPPTTVLELQSFIGAATYVSSYIPNFSKIMVPLYDLLKEGTKW